MLMSWQTCVHDEKFIVPALLLARGVKLDKAGGRMEAFRGD